MTNTKITLNKHVIYYHEPKEANIGKNILNELIDLSEEFILNDDGGKLKKKLSKFDISKDKKFGRFWTFKVNKESKDLIIKAFEQYQTFGHLMWTLIGKDFVIEYEEAGDEIETKNNDEDGVYNKFRITAKGEPLKKIQRIIDEYIV